jgi:hypothetical protein
MPPLQGQTTYTIHLGGGMRDADGNMIGMDQGVSQHGGRWATDGMMSGGMMSDRDMMGDGWQHENGTYGMVFTFTTG